MQRLLEDYHKTSVQLLPDLSAADSRLNILLTDGPLESGRADLFVFFHRIDTEGLEQAQRAMDTFEQSRLILVPSLVPWVSDRNVYMMINKIFADLETRNPKTAPIRLDYYLLVAEELQVRSRQSNHSSVKDYAALAKMIYLDKHLQFPRRGF
ncbi:hypothetical protein HYW42_01315 [Candidatus Daviesbacteria bacterium]|nr:hypothetical protein [Candidatus Daviesbacteria bacterium]